MWNFLILHILIFGQITLNYETEAWSCPIVDNLPNGECSCDLPHTLRCSGNLEALKSLGDKLRNFKEFISLLDLTLYNVTTLKEAILPSAVLHGLVISSGEIKILGSETFGMMAPNLEVLGLPNNQLNNVPTIALNKLPELLRLDLSGNQIKALNSDSFKNISTLTFLDFSRNLIRQITPDTFTELKQLQELRLTSNQITIPVISKLIKISGLRKLDLSRNLLSGLLNVDSLPAIKTLKDLQLSQNEITSIKANSFQNLINLSGLYLDHNHIDVIEDNAFLNLSNLSDLNLSYNRIVAVSESSLAHLGNLKSLDLSHNYLRALTGDLIKYSKYLKVLHLDYNDIAVISETFVNNSLVLKRLTMSNNPLNCDCHLINFVKWLENTTLTMEDKLSPKCATPPVFENGVLLNVFKEDLHCNKMVDIKPKITLISFDYDQNNLKLHWLLLNGVKVLKCKNIFIYEEDLHRENLMEDFYKSCNVKNVDKIISMSLFKVKKLKKFKNYRICLNSDDYNYCTQLFTLNENRHSLPINNNNNSQVISIKYNSTDFLTMNINSDIKKPCNMNIKLIKDDRVVYEKTIICDSSIVLKTIDYFSKPYSICASVVSENITSNKYVKPRCVIVYDNNTSLQSFENIIIIWILILICFVVGILIWKIRTLFVRPKLIVQSYSLPEVKVVKTGYAKLQDTKC